MANAEGPFLSNSVWVTRSFLEAVHMEPCMEPQWFTLRGPTGHTKHFVRLSHHRRNQPLLMHILYNTLILKFHWEIGSWCVSYLFVQFSGFGVVGFLHEISQLVTLEVEGFKFRRWALESPAPDRFSPRKSAGDAQVLTTCEPWWTTFPNISKYQERRKAFSIRQANSSTAICIWAFEHQISVQVGRFGRIWCWTSGTVGLWVLKSDGIAVIQLISRNSTPDIPDSLVITLNPFITYM